MPDLTELEFVVNDKVLNVVVVVEAAKPLFAAVAVAPVATVMLRPSAAVRFTPSLVPFTTAVTPVAAETDWIAAARLAACPATLAPAATAPMLTPLRTKSPAVMPVAKELMVPPVTVVALAVAVIFSPAVPLIAVALALALALALANDTPSEVEATILTPFN